MADEIHNQNVIQVWATESGWRARIGPFGLGIETGPHERPATALASLFVELAQGHWIFDPTWVPSLEQDHI